MSKSSMREKLQSPNPRKLFADYYRAERELITATRIYLADTSNVDADLEEIKREQIVNQKESRFTDAMRSAVSGFNGGRHTNTLQVQMTSFRDEKISMFAKKLSEKHADTEPAKTIITNVQESLKTRAWNPWLLSIEDYKNEAAKKARSASKPT